MGSSGEVGRADLSWDCVQGNWGHVWASVLGRGPLLQLTLVMGGPLGWAGQGSGFAGLVLGLGHPLGLQPPLPAFSCEFAGKA